MSEPITPSQLRQDIYRLIDRVIETGEPLVITRKGHHLELIATAKPLVGRLSRIVGNPGLVIGDPEDLVHTDWSQEWEADTAVDP